MENNQDKDSPIEYVEAEPIEVSQPTETWAQQPQMRVYTADARGCNPCCGPIGCIVFIGIIVYLVAKFEFLQNMILASVIALALMAVMMALTRRR